MTPNPKPTSADLRALLDSGEWKMVPVEATIGMVKAGVEAGGDWPETTAAAYRAMLRAAPSPEGDAENIGQQEEGADR